MYRVKYLQWNHLLKNLAVTRNCYTSASSGIVGLGVTMVKITVVLLSVLCFNRSVTTDLLMSIYFLLVVHILYKCVYTLSIDYILLYITTAASFIIYNFTAALSFLSHWSNWLEAKLGGKEMENLTFFLCSHQTPKQSLAIFTPLLMVDIVKRVLHTL